MLIVVGGAGPADVVVIVAVGRKRHFFLWFVVGAGIVGALFWSADFTFHGILPNFCDTTERLCSVERNGGHRVAPV